MIDTIIRPTYVDPWFGPYKGDPMDWTKAPFTQPIVRALLLKMNIVLRDKEMDNQPDDIKMFKAFSVDGFAWFISKAFEGKSGRTLTTDEEQKLEALVREVLEELTAEGLMEEVREGWWRGFVDSEATAEVTIGEGPESVYGWYLPAYRELAAMKEESRFPMKVGKTRAVPFKRIKAHIGTAPEQPKLGFLLKTDKAGLWERYLHIKLRMRGRHMAAAHGEEWFRTTPEELHEIVAPEIAALGQEAIEQVAKEGLL